MTELTLATELTGEQREYLGTIKRSIDSLITLVNDLLDLSRLEAGRVELEDVPFSLHDAVGDTVRTLAVRASSKGLRLDLESLDRVPDAVSGDPGRLRQVLVNLIGNAVKFTPVGSVVVSSEVWAQRGGEMEIHFAVRDSGIGIPDDIKDRIFEAFTQGDSSTSREYGGTGLGLAISSDLVRMMGGRIWVDSDVGEGSTFHFTIVVRRAVESSGAYFAPRDDGDDTQLSVGVVTGDPQAERTYSEMLRNAGLGATAVSAEDTLDMELLRSQDVVVVDIGAGTIDLCRQIAATGARPVAVVERGVPGDAALYRNAGAAGYLPQPVAPGDLADAIRHCGTSWQPGDPLVTIHWLRERRPKLHILVADDSAANRRLASRLLEKRGHSVVAVADGAAAVEAVAGDTFDVVLMDVQMPLMDGLQATEAIRSGGARWRQVPIVAPTAHASTADRARCLAAGMDAYVSKPFDAHELAVTLEPLSRGIAVPQASEVEPPLDRIDALSRVGGDEDLLAEVVSLFQDDYPRQVEAIVTGLADDDSDIVALAAHTLKGTLAMLGAAAASEAASQLTEAARSADMRSAAARWPLLQMEMERLQPELERLAKHTVRPPAF